MTESALQLNGRDAHASAVAAQLSGTQASFTIEAWVKLDVAPKGIWPVLQNEGIGLAVGVVKSRPVIGFQENEIPGRTHLQPGIWHHLAWSFDARTGELAISVNGVLDFAAKSKPLHPVLGRGDIVVGLYQGVHFHGELTELRIWDRALGQSEIQKRMYRRVTGPEAGLVECWPLNQTHGLKNIVTGAAERVHSPHPDFGELSVDGVDLEAPLVYSPRSLIEIPHQPSLNFSAQDDFTVELWFSADTSEPQSKLAWLLKNELFSIAIDLHAGVLIGFRGDDTVIAAKEFPVLDGETHHVAFVKRGNALELYVDGEEPSEEKDSYRAGRLAKPAPLQLGVVEIEEEAGLWFAELRLWTVAREPSDIAKWRVRRLSEQAPSYDEGLVGYWPLSPNEDDLGFTYLGRNEILPHRDAQVDGQVAWDTEPGLPMPWQERAVASFKHGYVEIGAYRDRDFADGLCVEAWVKPAIAVQDLGQSPVVSAHLPDAGFELRCAQNRAEFLMTFAREHVTVSVPVGPSYPMVSGRWVHLAAVYDRNAIHLYVNGVLAKSESVGDGAYTQFRHDVLFIGGTPATRSFFAGQIAEVRLWESAQTGEQILRRLFQPDQSDDGLIGYWPLNENAPRVSDRSKSKLIGQLTDASWGSGFLAPGLIGKVVDAGDAGERPKTDKEKIAALRSEKRKLQATLEKVTQERDRQAANLDKFKKKLESITKLLSTAEAERDELKISADRVKEIEAFMKDQGAVPLKKVISNTERQIREARKVIAEEGAYRLGSVTMDLRFGLVPDGSAIFPKAKELLTLQEPFSSLKLNFEEAPLAATPDLVVVPDLTKQTETMARRTLAGAGLQTETQFQVIKEQAEGEIDMVGRVVGQAPQDGETVEQNSTVRIFIGRTN